MVVKTINYIDFNGENQTTTAYFHLSKADIIKMEVFKEGGLKAAIEKMVETEDGPELISLLEDILKNSYGVKSEDGKRFIKDKQAFEEFCETEAYSELFVELISNPESATEFMRGLVPNANN